MDISFDTLFGDFIKKFRAKLEAIDHEGTLMGSRVVDLESILSLDVPSGDSESDEETKTPGVRKA